MRTWGAVLCALWCVIACAVIGVRVTNARAFDTDIQSLLPQSALEPVIRAAITDASAVASRHIAVLVSADDPLRAQEAAADLERALTEAGVFTPDRADGEAMGRWLFANRNALLCENDPARFNGEAAAQTALAMLYAPTAPISGEMLTRDPFLRTLTLSQCLAPPVGGSIGDASLVSGSLTQTAFRIDVQDAVSGAFDAWRTRWPDVRAARTGAVFHAAHGARQARQEMALIAGVSTVAILLLLAFSFRRAEALAATLAMTAASTAGALAVTLLVFPSVHVLVFVFGSALIGITSDYALHYLATGPQSGWAPVEERIKRVARPLAVCAASTGLGFASLALFGVPIFNQIAVFSVAGIATAWLFTLTLLPLMDRRSRHPEKLAGWWEKLEAPFRAIRPTRAASVIGVIVIVALAVVAGLRFTTLDDVRRFQPLSAELEAEEAQVRQALGFSASPLFLLSYGESANAAREREEAALATLSPEAIRDVLAVSRFDPSTTRRAANAAALQSQLYAPHLNARVDMLGLTDAAPFAAGEALLPPMLQALSGETDGVHYLVAPLGAVAAAEIRANGEGAMVVDPAARYTQAFAAFRSLGALAAAAAFAVCALIVLVLYRTPRALVVLAAPLVGVAMAIAVPSALGAPISFFSVAALFVVLGAGVDHSVFQFEAAETDGQTKELAVFLAALTTILSMGLLALSGTYPVKSFGMAIAAGVGAAYLVSFIPARVWGSRKRADD